MAVSQNREMDSRVTPRERGCARGDHIREKEDLAESRDNDMRSKQPGWVARVAH